MLHGLNDFLWKLSSSCGCWPNRALSFLQLCIVGQHNVFELLDDIARGFMHVFDKFNDEI